MTDWPTIVDDDSTGLTGTIFCKAITDAMKNYINNSGLDANKPASPVVGQKYVATDTEIVYVCYIAGVWTVIGGEAESAYFSKRVFYTMFEALDFIDVTNVVTLDKAYGLKIDWDSGDSVAKILRTSIANKNLAFASQAIFPGVGDAMAFLGLGNGHPALDSYSAIGFLVDNWPDDGGIWALSGNGGGGGTQVKTVISGVDVTLLHHYRAVFTAGSKIEFYVDNVLKATHTTFLPTDSIAIARLMVGTAAGSMYVYWYAYEEEL